MIEGMTRDGNQLPIGKTLLGGGLLLGGLYAVYRISQASPRHTAAPYVGAEVPCVDAALRADLWRANLWAGGAVHGYFSTHPPTEFMLLMTDPVKGDSKGKPEFAATVRLDISTITAGGMPLAVYVDHVDLTTKVQYARGFSYLGLKFKNPQMITAQLWSIIGEAIADYVQRHATPITEAMIKQSGWPECP